MDGIRGRGFPRFVDVLQRDYDWSLLDEQQFKPVQYVCESPDDLHVARAHGRDASVALWKLLARLPKPVIEVDDAVVFLIGYTPHAAVPLSDEDALTISSWQGILSGLFALGIQGDLSGANDEGTKAFQEKFLNIVDAADEVLVPRLKFWHKVRS